MEADLVPDVPEEQSGQVPLVALRNRKMTIPVYDLPAVIGRSRQNADVVFYESSVSRRHCMLDIADGRPVIMDLGSTVGTSVDQKDLAPNENCNIDDGQQVRIGDNVFVVEINYPAIAYKYNIPIRKPKGRDTELRNLNTIPAVPRNDVTRSVESGNATVFPERDMNYSDPFGSEYRNPVEGGGYGMSEEHSTKSELARPEKPANSVKAHFIDVPKSEFERMPILSVHPVLSGTAPERLPENARADSAGISDTESGVADEYNTAPQPQSMESPVNTGILPEMDRPADADILPEKERSVPSQPFSPKANNLWSEAEFETGLDSPKVTDNNTEEEYGRHGGVRITQDMPDNGLDDIRLDSFSENQADAVHDNATEGGIHNDPDNGRLDDNGNRITESLRVETPDEATELFDSEETEVLAYTEAADGTTMHLFWEDGMTGETDDIVLDRNPFHIGRKAENNDYAVNVRGVSRRHLYLNRINGQYYVHDMYSTNGVRINGEVIPPGRNIPVNEGDTIGIGNREYSFERIQ